MLTCRLCLLKIEVDSQITSLTENENFISMIKDCVSIEISLSDNYPKVICVSCTKKLNEWHVFKKVCIESENFLKNNLKEIVSKESSHILQEVENNKGENDKWVSESENESEEDECDPIKVEVEDRQAKKPTENTCYKCELCKKDFDCYLHYLEHQDEHEGQHVLKCEQCDQQFNSKKELAHHERNHKIPCPHCGKLVQRSSMNLHVNKHTDRFVCPTCSHRFCSRAELEQHKITVHTDIKNHICETCGKRFSSKTSMNVHLKSHQEERQYICKLCDYAGRTASAIYTHMSTHANEVHVCEICSKSFKSNRNLNDHLRRVHVKEKKHVCSYCQKKFVDRYTLSVHFRIHTGTRPYKCKLCEKSFARSDNLKEHYQTHDRNTFYECKDCHKKFINRRGRLRHNCVSVSE